ncbi:polyprenyl synthetase family protein, partial [Candidatus Woesearchaeota archaeon]|nr:polyprenyl synthetase family protein [Candidatus Woesearchaeota archaeon]
MRPCPIDVKKVLEKYRILVDAALESYFKKKETSLKSLAPISKTILSDLKEYTLRGGKRIRAILVIFGYKAFSGRCSCCRDPPALSASPAVPGSLAPAQPSPGSSASHYPPTFASEKEIIKAAAAVELMQSFLLVHDDIIDNDDLRRGKPTLHRIYSERYSASSSAPTELGKGIAIVAGDLLSALGNEILADSGFPQKNKLEAIRIFNNAVMVTCFGQVMDTLSSHSDDWSEAEIDWIHKMKTAVYTLEAPLHIGAALAGAGPCELAGLSGFAIPLGRAFQIQDDMLGLFGNEEKLGKPIGSDLREGKKTLLITEAIRRACHEDKSFLKHVLGKKDISQDEIKRTVDIVRDTGSLEYSRKKAETLINESKKALETLDIEQSAKEFFIAVA